MLHPDIVIALNYSQETAQLGWGRDRLSQNDVRSEVLLPHGFPDNEIAMVE